MLQCPLRTLSVRLDEPGPRKLTRYLRNLSSPVYGVIFLFKYIGSASSTKGAPQEGAYSDTDPSLFFAHQTIQNACATQAILSVVLNNNAANTSVPPEAAIDVGEPLTQFQEFTESLPPDLVGEAISNSVLIRETHNSFAKSSPFADETQRDPDAGTEDAFHFIGYTVRNGVLYELDGLQPQPISHRSSTFDEFPDKIIPILQSRIARYPPEEVRFNLMAVCRDLRIQAAQIGDVETLEREKGKRAQWAWENALRRHNFVGFIGEVLKGVVKQKVEAGDETYEGWIEDAKKATKKKLEDRRERLKGAGEEEK